MELQIQDLVSSIKKDGIESANREAAQILADLLKRTGAAVYDAEAQLQHLFLAGRQRVQHLFKLLA